MVVRIPIKTNHCPHCDENIPVHGDDDYLYGSPIQTCPKCGKQYLDKHYHEAEIEGFAESDLSAKSSFKDVLSYGGIALVILIINIVLWMLRRVSWLLWLAFAVDVVLILSKLKNAIKVLTGKRKKELEAEKQKSVDRLQNREYASTLKQLGYSVPEKYL